MAATFAERVASRLAELEADLREDIELQQQRWNYRFRRGRAWFDHERQAAHRRLRQGIVRWVREGSIGSLLTAPLVYSLILPLAVLDAWVTVYQRICFPIYGIPRVARRSFFALDRHRLHYLNGIEKVNCTYCSYGLGVIAYVREVAARTEQYWCPIKHATTIPTPHARYHLFFDYGDGESYRRDLPAIRTRFEAGAPDASGHVHGDDVRSNP